MINHLAHKTRYQHIPEAEGRGNRVIVAAIADQRGIPTRGASHTGPGPRQVAVATRQIGHETLADRRGMAVRMLTLLAAAAFGQRDVQRLLAGRCRDGRHEVQPQELD